MRVSYQDIDGDYVELEPVAVWLVASSGAAFPIACGNMLQLDSGGPNVSVVRLSAFPVAVQFDEPANENVWRGPWRFDRG